MSLATIATRAKIGVQAPKVTVETHLSNGLPGLAIVGLPEAVVKESKDRVRSALLNSGFEFPARRITINLAPAELPKDGGRFDLAIAIGIMAASGQVNLEDCPQLEFYGELALSGDIRPVPGLLPAALQCSNQKGIAVIPAQNEAEVSMVSGLKFISVDSLAQLATQLSSYGQLKVITTENTQDLDTADGSYKDMADIKGQYQAKRALEVAAAGGHNLLMYGPPGTGKTMLASRLPGILPILSESDALEAASVRSVAGRELNSAEWRQRCFRSPHHTASAAAMVGGGSPPKPGEISLAHNGVLFLDELPEFDRKVLEVLREPMESGEIVISRAAQQITFPARFQLVAAMNPCPCGYSGHPQIACRCSDSQKQRYRQKISGPLLDRFDLHIEVPSIKISELQSGKKEEPSSEVKKRVLSAREIAQQRNGYSNQYLQGDDFANHCYLADNLKALLDQALQKLGMSARAYHRILRVARTLADLQDSSQIQSQHLMEALSFRMLDRQ